MVLSVRERMEILERASLLTPKLKPEDVDPEELRRGIKVELEHTKSRKVAEKIALHHLDEDPKYYTKLKKIHSESSRSPWQDPEDLFVPRMRKKITQIRTRAMRSRADIRGKTGHPMPSALVIPALREGMLSNKDRTVNPRAPGRRGAVLHQILRKLAAYRHRVQGAHSRGSSTQGGTY